MIKINSLYKKYDNIFPVRDFSFTFDTGKKYTILGPSGSGKTTLLRLISGFESIDDGDIYRDDILIGNKHFQMHPFDRRIAMVFQKPSLWPHLTIHKNIAFGLQHYNKSDKEQKVNAIMCDMEITHLADKYPSQISGGEGKRVALARVMVLEWKYLLLDEALANLDSELKLRITEKINRYVSLHNTTLIHVTHDNKEAEMIAGEVINLKNNL